MNKKQKIESMYITKVLNTCSDNTWTMKQINLLSVAFNKFSKDIKQDKIALLRTGEVMLRTIFI